MFCTASGRHDQASCRPSTGLFDQPVASETSPGRLYGCLRYLLYCHATLEAAAAAITEHKHSAQHAFWAQAFWTQASCCMQVPCTSWGRCLHPDNYEAGQRVPVHKVAACSILTWGLCFPPCMPQGMQRWSILLTAVMRSRFSHPASVLPSLQGLHSEGCLQPSPNPRIQTQAPPRGHAGLPSARCCWIAPVMHLSASQVRQQRRVRVMGVTAVCHQLANGSAGCNHRPQPKPRLRFSSNKAPRARLWQAATTQKVAPRQARGRLCPRTPLASRRSHAISSPRLVQQHA